MLTAIKSHFNGNTYTLPKDFSYNKLEIIVAKPAVARVNNLKNFSKDF